MQILTFTILPVRVKLVNTLSDFRALGVDAEGKYYSAWVGASEWCLWRRGVEKLTQQLKLT